MTNTANKLFSVWAQNSSGDLFAMGERAGRAMTREQAWEAVKAVRAGFWGPVTKISVQRGCTVVWTGK